MLQETWCGVTGLDFTSTGRHAYDKQSASHRCAAEGVKLWAESIEGKCAAAVAKRSKEPCCWCNVLSPMRGCYRLIRAKACENKQSLLRVGAVLRRWTYLRPLRF